MIIFIFTLGTWTWKYFKTTTWEVRDCAGLPVVPLHPPQLALSKCIFQGAVLSRTSSIYFLPPKTDFTGWEAVFTSLGTEFILLKKY